MKRVTDIFLLIFIFSIAVKGQDKVRLFYTNNWEVTNLAGATFFRDAEYDLNRFKLNGRVADFNQNQTLVMEGSYSNGLRNGRFVFYFPNGNTKSEGEYTANQRTGEWRYYYLNGNLKQIIQFTEKDMKPDFSVVEYFNPAGKPEIVNGTGKWLNDSIITGLFDTNSLKKLTGQFKNGQKQGEWKLTRLSDNQLMHSELFKNNEFRGATIYNEQMGYMGTISSEMLDKMPDENQIKFNQTERFKLDPGAFPETLIYSDVETIFSTVTGQNIVIRNRPAGYKFGDLSLMDFIQQNIQFKSSAIDNRIAGTVYVRILIDSLGTMKNCEILRGLSKDLDEEAVRVVKLINDWMPALVEGKAIDSFYGIPVRFEIRQ